MFLTFFFQTTTNISFSASGARAVLQMTTINVKQFTSSDIAYLTRMIFKPIHTKKRFGYLF